MNPASPESTPGPGSGSEVGPPAGRGARSGPGVAPRSAWGVLALVIAMQALIAVDVGMMAAVLVDPRVWSDLGLEPVEAGWLPTVLLIGAAVAGPMVGYLADRLRRPRLLAIAFAAWSLAVVATGLARSYDQVHAARAAAGAGGAAATVVALTLLADRFPRRMRGRAFAGFFVAMPVGAVLGPVLAAALSPVAGWPSAFFTAGALGLPLALLALLVPEPVRGASEPVDGARLRLHEHFGPSQHDYIDLMVNSSFNYSVFGMAFGFFALAGLAYGLPAFLDARAPVFEGAGSHPLRILSTAVAFGTIGGGWLADAFAATRPRWLFLVPGMAMLAGIGGLLTILYGRSPLVTEAALFLAGIAISLVIAPAFTILAGVSMPNMRGVGFGVALAAGHVLGDIWPPTLIGWVSDTFAQPDAMATGFGTLLAAIGAVPVTRPGHDPENLAAGLLAIVPALLIAGAVLLAGIRHVPRELALMIAKLRAAPTRRS